MVGFDDVESNTYFPPRLTIVELPLEAIDAAAVEILLPQIAVNDSRCKASVSRVLPVRLKIGESSAPQRSAK